MNREEELRREPDPETAAASARAEREKNRAVAFTVLMACHAVALFWEVTGWYFWKLWPVTVLGYALQLANAAGFHWIWRHHGNEEMAPWRRRYDRCCAWLLTWFPAWLVTTLLWQCFPHAPYLEPVSAVAVYLLLSLVCRKKWKNPD